MELDKMRSKFERYTKDNGDLGAFFAEYSKNPETKRFLQIFVDVYGLPPVTTLH